MIAPVSEVVPSPMALLLAEPGTSDPFSPDATCLLNAMANAPTDPGSVENTVDGFKSRFGNDYISENDGDDKINGGWGNDTIYGRGGDDTIYASTGGGGISGGEGDDILNSGKDDDVIKGGTRQDTVTGGDGHDRLYGGTGADTFVFTTNGGKGWIKDWEVGVDVLDLSALGYTNFSKILSLAWETPTALRFNFDEFNRISIEGITLSDISESDILLA